jgi:pyridoxal phosphate enzyme (YggS family)
MLISPQNWAEKVAAVRSRIATAAARAGRDPNSVTIVAVSKAQPAHALQAVQATGVSDFGESYLQEAIPKMEQMQQMHGGGEYWEGLRWHFIGRVQTNKTRTIATAFDWVHSVDRLQIAQRLSAQRPAAARPLNLCLQVRLVDEPSKAGVEPHDLPGLAAEVAALERARLRGLMCVPPATHDQVQQRSWFRRLRELQEELNVQGHRLDTLSMGMSGDFEVAIEEGATHLRIGTAIFGPRTVKEP